MSQNDTYTPAEVCKTLRIPSSSLRRYAAEYSDYLSEQARVSGRMRRYTDTDLAIIKKIRELTVQKYPPEEIKAQIAVIDEPLELLDPKMLDFLESTRARFAQLESDYQQLLKSHTAQQTELDALRDELTQLREQLSRPLFSRITDIFRKR